MTAKKATAKSASTLYAWYGTHNFEMDKPEFLGIAPTLEALLSDPEFMTCVRDYGFKPDENVYVFSITEDGDEKPGVFLRGLLFPNGYKFEEM